MGGLPEVLGDDTEVRGLHTQPLALGALEVALDPPLVPLLDPVPNDLAPVERPAEDLADGRGRPAARPPRRRHAVLVERLRDLGDTQALDGEREDPPHDGGLGPVDAADHVRACAARAEDLDVVVAVDAAAGNVAGGRLPSERVVGPLPGLLPLQLGGEVGEGEHHLFHGALSSVRSRSSR
jgi:hypothetical protein